MAYVDRPQPATGLEGKFSFQYTMAAALLDGRVGIDTFTDARRFRADMAALLGKIEFVQDSSIPGNWTQLYVVLEVQLRDGRRFETRCDGPPGAWGRAPLPPERHEEKLRDCLAGVLDSRKAARLLKLLGSLEKQTPRGVAEIAGILGGTGARRGGRQGK